MPFARVRLLTAIALTLCTITAPLRAQDYSEERLNTKQQFTDAQVKALAEPYVGVRTSEGLRSGLYPLRSTGVSTEPVRQAAAKFLQTLTPNQRIRTQYAIGDAEWRRWSNVSNGVYIRQGTSLKDMNPAQRSAAWELLRASLSAKGLALTKGIMATDQTLQELNKDLFNFDSELYFLTIMGVPEAGKPWGWQFEGHHLAINYFVLGDQVVMTPTFWGAEPARTTTGSQAGNMVLQGEQAQGLALMRSLDDSQRQRATLNARKPGNVNLAEANKDNLVLDYAGLPATAMTPAQRSALMALAESYVANMRDGHARAKMEEVRRHLDETWFAWMGATDDDAVFYYRIHSPVLLIEFDHQTPAGLRMRFPAGQPIRDHVHTVVRTPNGNDYGKDLLGQHLREAHSKR